MPLLTAAADDGVESAGTIDAGLFLSHLLSALSPVLGFHAWPQLCSLFSALSPVLGFVACPQLSP